MLSGAGPRGGFPSLSGLWPPFCFVRIGKRLWNGWKKPPPRGHYSACNTIQNLYTQMNEICSDERECHGIVRVHDSVREICRGVRLALIPYVPEIRKRSLFSFSTSLSPGINFSTETKEGDEAVSASLSRPIPEGDWFKVGYGDDSSDDSGFSVYGLPAQINRSGLRFFR